MPRVSIFGENAKLISFRLYSWEKELVREFLKKLRDKKRKEIMRKKNAKNIRTRI